jgi:hypothetical protein
MGRNEYTYKNGYNGTLAERMEKKTIKSGENDCWKWIASCDTAKYPTIRVGHKLCRASHVAFELYNNVTIPNGMVIMHSCDNPNCVNPKHLSIGTKALNNLDKKQKGRCNSCKGELHPMRKLTQKDVDKIRKLFSTGNHKYIEIASLFNVDRTTISNIVNQRTWR